MAIKDKADQRIKRINDKCEEIIAAQVLKLVKTNLKSLHKKSIDVTVFQNGESTIYLDITIRMPTLYRKIFLDNKIQILPLPISSGINKAYRLAINGPWNNMKKLMNQYNIKTNLSKETIGWAQSYVKYLTFLSIV